MKWSIRIPSLHRFGNGEPGEGLRRYGYSTNRRSLASFDSCRLGWDNCRYGLDMGSFLGLDKCLKIAAILSQKPTYLPHMNKWRQGLLHDFYMVKIIIRKQLFHL